MMMKIKKVIKLSTGYEETYKFPANDVREEILTLLEDYEYVKLSRGNRLVTYEKIPLKPYRVVLAMDVSAENEEHAVEQFVNAYNIDPTDVIEVIEE